MTTFDAKTVWAEYRKGVSYKTRLGLYETVRQCEDFYVGDQWKGVNAPDLPKPTLNMLKRVVAYFNAMIVSDDVAIRFSPYVPDPSLDKTCSLLSCELGRTLEATKARAKHREALRNAAVDGDACFYLWFDPDQETGQAAKGDVTIEIAENTCVHFGNPYTKDVQSQPYIILSMRRPAEEVRAEAENCGVSPSEAKRISPSMEPELDEPFGGDGLVTVLLRLWKQKGTVWAQKSVKDLILREAWDTGLKLYPVAWMCWEASRNSCHGAGAIKGLIPNQIAVNKLFAMAIRSVEMNAFPKIIYDATKIDRWSNRVGEAIAVAGSPENTIVSGIRGSDMSAQVMELIHRTVSMTRDFMGASDAALGNVNPVNTSAIIAVQKASAAPLDLQRLNFYQFIEDYALIIADMMRACYGKRKVAYTDENGDSVTEEFDFSTLDTLALKVRIDVGEASYWSELMQVHTLDNLYAKGILTDAEEYLNSIPDHYIKDKPRLLKALREHREQQMMKGDTT
ncbi:MAG: hypothetical protein ACOYIR_02325 [Christensenellales bacterium]|jgi:hypothetical protein